MILLFWLTNLAVFSSISSNFSVSKFLDFSLFWVKFPNFCSLSKIPHKENALPFIQSKWESGLFWLQHNHIYQQPSCSSPHCNSSQLKIASNWRFVTNLLQKNKLIADNWWPVKNLSTVKPIYDGHWMANCLAMPLYEVNLLCNSICKSTCLYGHFLLKILVVIQSSTVQ